jgi:hypothetical protein
METASKLPEIWQAELIRKAKILHLGIKRDARKKM